MVIWKSVNSHFPAILKRQACQLNLMDQKLKDLTEPIIALVKAISKHEWVDAGNHSFLFQLFFPNLLV